MSDLLERQNIAVNINQQCMVTLKERGIEALEQHYQRIGIPQPKIYAVGDQYTGRLWEIMNIFGVCTYMGPPPPFETKIHLRVL